MRKASFVLAAAAPRGLAWLSLLAISAGVAYAMTAAVAASGPTAEDTCGIRCAQMAEAQAVARLRSMLARRGFGTDVLAGPMTGRAPGLTAAWPEALALDYVVDDDMDAMIGPVQNDAWLVFTAAGRWWLWTYGVAAPADRRAQAAEVQAIRHAGPEVRGID